MRTIARPRQRFTAIFASAILLLAALFSFHSWAAPDSTLGLSTSSVAQESSVTLTGEGFAPGEVVALWQTLPDYSVAALPSQAADDNGRFQLELFVGSDLPLGLHIFTARGESSGREEYAELTLTVAQGPQPSEATLLQAEPQVERQGAIVLLQGQGFAAGEQVALWGRYPDGGSFDLAQVTSDGAGRFAAQLAFGGNPTGIYVFSAQGLSTGRFSTVEMLLQVGDLTGPAQPASLVARPLAGEQRGAVVLEGNGFDAGEIVTIWTTLPDNSTIALAQATSNEQGRFFSEIVLDETLPAGQYTFSARGNLSGRLATVGYLLAVGGGPRQP